MHPNPAFRKTPEAHSIKAARAHGFGALLLNGAETPLCSHIPFCLSKDGTMAEAHLVRSNPIAQVLAKGERPALLTVLCADAYISPDWYGQPDQVPTWNYVAAHFKGILRARPAETLTDHLARLSAMFESRLAPKPAWLIDKVDPEVRQRLMRMILPVELEITAIDSTWKLAQNKDDHARLAAAEALAQDGFNAGSAAIAELMKNPPVTFD